MIEGDTNVDTGPTQMKPYSSMTLRNALNRFSCMVCLMMPVVLLSVLAVAKYNKNHEEPSQSKWMTIIHPQIKNGVHQTKIFVWTPERGTQIFLFENKNLDEFTSGTNCWAVTALTCAWHDVFKDSDQSAEMNPYGCNMKNGASVDMENYSILHSSILNFCKNIKPDIVVDPEVPYLRKGEGEIMISTGVIDVGDRRIITTTLSVHDVMFNGQTTYPKKINVPNIDLIATKYALGCVDSYMEDNPLKDFFILNAKRAHFFLLSTNIFAGPTMIENQDGLNHIMDAIRDDLSIRGWRVCSQYVNPRPNSGSQYLPGQ